MPSLLADFVAYLIVDDNDWEDPVEGRVLLTNEQLVLAKNEDEKEEIPLKQIFDVNLGAAPAYADQLPGQALTIAYSVLGDRSVVFVGCGERESEKFRSVLFKGILNGTQVTLKHPAQVGGRVMDNSFEGGILSLSAACVSFQREGEPVSIDLGSVVNYTRETRNINGEEQRAIVVSHMNDGEDQMTIAATESGRKLSLLGRYMQRRYQSVLESLKGIQVKNEETEVLTTLYSVGEMDVSLASVVEVHPKRVKPLLQSLHQKGLVEPGDPNPKLTARGQIVVNEYLERVNE